jgi:putative cardiolipin synthase
VDTVDTRLGRDIAPLVAQHPGTSGFYAMQNGIDAFAARALLIHNADKTLDLQYYIWHDDLTGKALHNLLLQAADRGIRVRLLLDDLDTTGKDEMLVVIDSHPNIEIRLFNPFANRSARVLDFLGDARRVNHRMHNKALIADNQATIFGGRNIGNEYFDAEGDVGFQDMDVLAIGPIVQEVSDEFDLYWSSKYAYPLAGFYGDTSVPREQIKAFRQQSEEFMQEAKSTDYAVALRELDIVKMARVGELDYSWGTWVFVYDQPRKVDSKKVTLEVNLAPRLKQAMDRTTNELIIVSPYFVPGSRFTKYLVDLVDKGVRVRILTNSLASNDVALVHAGYMRYRKALVEGGVELYEFKPIRGDVESAKKKTKASWSGSSRASLHGKFMSFDQQYVFVGSFNLDGRSIALNTELGVYFESPRYAQAVSELFDQRINFAAYRVSVADNGNLHWTTMENGEVVSFTHEPETGFWKRFGANFMSVFVPESQL